MSMADDRPRESAVAYRSRSGKPYTEEELEGLADWTLEHARFDLDAIRRGRPARGRPPLAPDTNGHSPRIAVRLPGDLHDRVTQLAATEGRSVSELVRALIEDYVAATGADRVR